MSSLRHVFVYASPPLPRVSVIVPARNAEQYLGQTLESILSQTYGDWEAVVVDDASTDRTFEVAATFTTRDPRRFRALRLTENAGPAVARNAGIAASSGGELVALLDADDYWLPQYLERQIAAFDEAHAKGRSVGIVSCNAYIAASDGEFVGTFADRWWADRITYDLMIERSYIFISALFTRAAYDEVGGFSAECWGSEDYDLWLRIIERRYEVVANREPLAVYRFHDAGLSRSQLVMANAAIAAYTRALARGAITPRQRRAIKARLRHYRALRDRALLRRALAEGRPTKAAAIAARAVPRGLVAFAQDPARWGEWVGDILSRRTKARRHGALTDARL